MRVIVGLGNPGIDYVGTRHNAGVLFVERLAETLNNDYGWRAHKAAMVFETPKVILAKSKDKFMNESGVWVKELLKNTSDPESILVHDDLDIRLGEFKMQMGTGPKVHYGVQSVENALGTKDFMRVRIGVDNRDPNNRIPGESYVLQKFTTQELTILDKVFQEIIDISFAN